MSIPVFAGIEFFSRNIPFSELHFLTEKGPFGGQKSVL
jgi:hypothetical protein